LADAELKAGLYNDALCSIYMAKKSPYPSKEKINALKKVIISKMSRAGEQLYPAPVRSIQGTKFGYINNLGEMEIPPTFDYALGFQPNDLAIAGIGDLQGIINKSGRYVIPPKFQFIAPFSEGRAVVIDNSGFQLIDKQGTILTPKAYSYISSLSDGRALANNTSERTPTLYGYLDRSGSEIIPLKYEDASDFKLGKAVVKKAANIFYLINIDGDILHTYNYYYVGNHSEGLLPFQLNPNSRHGFIDEMGNIVIPPNYTSVEPFKDSRSVVNISDDYTNKYGLINKTGKFIYNPIYNSILMLGNNRVALGKAINPTEPYIGSIYALGDTDGNILTDFKYYDIQNFKNSLASVYDGTNTYFLNENGTMDEQLPIVRGRGTLSLEDGLIRADIDYRTSYYDKISKLVWKENSIIPLNGNKDIVEIKFNPNKDYLVYYPELKGRNNASTLTEINSKLKDLSQVKDIDPNEQLGYSYYGDYSIEFFKNRLLVPLLFGYQYYFGAAHGSPTRVYPHIDLVSGRFYNLEDLFKKDSDYTARLSKIINEKIKTDKQYDYVFPDQTIVIKPDQPFYVHSDALFIYFTPYEIAPYSAGFPTFRIPYGEIMDIIDTNGEFWKSFN